MYAPVAGGAAAVVPGGPLSYMQKYYQPGPSGMAHPGAQGAAYGYDPRRPMINRGGFSGLGNQQLPPGQWYFDQITGQWRRV